MEPSYYGIGTIHREDGKTIGMRIINKVTLEVSDIKISNIIDGKCDLINSTNTGKFRVDKYPIIMLHGGNKIVMNNAFTVINSNFDKKAHGLFTLVDGYGEIYAVPGEYLDSFISRLKFKDGDRELFTNFDTATKKSIDNIDDIVGELYKEEHLRLDNSGRDDIYDMREGDFKDLIGFIIKEYGFYINWRKRYNELREALNLDLIPSINEESNINLLKAIPKLLSNKRNLVYRILSSIRDESYYYNNFVANEELLNELGGIHIARVSMVVCEEVGCNYLLWLSNSWRVYVDYATIEMASDKIIRVHAGVYGDGCNCKDIAFRADIDTVPGWFNTEEEMWGTGVPINNIPNRTAFFSKYNYNKIYKSIHGVGLSELEENVDISCLRKYADRGLLVANKVVTGDYSGKDISDLLEINDFRQFNCVPERMIFMYGFTIGYGIDICIYHYLPLLRELNEYKYVNRSLENVIEVYDKGIRTSVLRKDTVESGISKEKVKQLISLGLSKVINEVSCLELVDITRNMHIDPLNSDFFLKIDIESVLWRKRLSEKELYNCFEKNRRAFNIEINPIDLCAYLTLTYRYSRDRTLCMGIGVGGSESGNIVSILLLRFSSIEKGILFYSKYFKELTEIKGLSTDKTEKEVADIEGTLDRLVGTVASKINRKEYISTLEPGMDSNIVEYIVTCNELGFEYDIWKFVSYLGVDPNTTFEELGILRWLD